MSQDSEQGPSAPESGRDFDRSRARSEHNLRNWLARGLWGVTYALLFRPSPRPVRAWRRWLLRLFGAKMGRRASVDPTCKVWAPWNLQMGDFSCMGPRVDCYCVAPVKLGDHAIVSQYSYLCSATHDPADPRFKLVTSPITLKAKAWVAADVFVGPGVTIGEGAVVGARASVYKDVPPWVIVGGNPAKVIKERTIRADSADTLSS